MYRHRKKVCRECGRIYVRHRVRTNPTLGWCSPNCYQKSYLRRRKGKAAGEPPDPVDDGAIQEPHVLESLARVLREASPQEGTIAESEVAEGDEAGAMSVEVVADRALVVQERVGDDDRVEVEWVGRCWAWLTEGEAPSLVDVAVRDGEIVKLLEPGQVRRVRAVERAIATPRGEVGGLEVWMDFRGFRPEPEPEDLRATVRGLWEGGKVRIAGRSSHDQWGQIGTLLRFHAGVVEVDGKRFGTGLEKLEPLDGPDDPPVLPVLAVENRVDGEIEEEDDSGELLLDVVANRTLVAQTRFGEDDRVGVEWVGHCWVWLAAGEAPSLMEVVVRDGRVARLLEPGRVRRVQALERTIETPEGEVDGLELWVKPRPEIRVEPEPDPRATARGLWEGGKVRLPPERPWENDEGRVGTLLRFSIATVEVDGRRFTMGPRSLEPLDRPDGSPTGTAGGS